MGKTATMGKITTWNECDVFFEAESDDSVVCIGVSMSPEFPFDASTFVNFTNGTAASSPYFTIRGKDYQKVKDGRTWLQKFLIDKFDAEIS